MATALKPTKRFACVQSNEATLAYNAAYLNIFLSLVYYNN